MVRIFCKNSGETRQFPAGVSLMDVYNNLDLNLPYDAVAASVNNEVVGLTYRVYRHKDVEFLDITSDDGMRVYVHSLTFIMMKAMHELFPGRVVRLENPISRGYYCRAETELTEKEVDSIRNHMHDIIERDIPFRRVECHTDEAIEKFNSIPNIKKIYERTILLFPLKTLSYSIIVEYADSQFTATSKTGIKYFFIYVIISSIHKFMLVIEFLS